MNRDQLISQQNAKHESEMNQKQEKMFYQICNVVFFSIYCSGLCKTVFFIKLF